jgi:putative hydrolase of the HAD superfamily
LYPASVEVPINKLPALFNNAIVPPDEFWNTIAFSNPEFKSHRSDYLHKILKNVYSKEVIQNCLRDCSTRYNQHIESGGLSKAPFVLYGDLIGGIASQRPSDEELLKITDEINQLFYNYSPVLSVDFVVLLKALKSMTCSISITSNTAYISGSQIKNCLDKWGIGDLFDFYLFSDEFGYAKPTESIYLELLRRVLGRHGKVDNDKILHVGDDELNDILGASKFGITTYKVCQEN